MALLFCVDRCEIIKVDKIAIGVVSLGRSGVIQKTSF